MEKIQFIQLLVITPTLLGGGAFAEECNLAESALENGDFDDLPAGTPPDCGEDAGAWGWPVHYIDADLCEAAPEQFQIVATDTFDAGATGNSLHLNVVGSPGSHHLPNLFEPIVETPDEILVIMFDIWVIEKGEKGGNFYVSGDHGGGGFGAGIDRGPQIGWQADGTVTRAPGDEPDPVVLLEDYPVGVWQTVRLEIDLTADNYDIYWAMTGESLTLLEANAPFHSSVALDHLDRVTVVHFPTFGGSSAAYFDNFCVEVLVPIPGDLDGDGKVGFSDLLIVLAAWGDCPMPPEDCTADLDGDGMVGFSDLLVVLSNWTA